MNSFKTIKIKKEYDKGFLITNVIFTKIKKHKPVEHMKWK